MYHIIGGDQREYGPATVEQIRQWIAEGRANGATLVRHNDASDWKPLADVPELAAFLSTPPVIAAPSRLDGFPSVELFEEYARRANALDVGHCLSRAWNLYRENFWLLTGASAILLLINIAIQFVPVAGAVLGAVFGLVFWAGFDLLTLKLIRGQPTDLNEAFLGFQIQFQPLMLASVITAVGISLGLIACVIPGLYLMAAWLLIAPMLIIDRRMDFWPALELNRQLFNRCLGTLLALFAVTLALTLGGALLFGVGIFFTLPLANTALVYAYEDIFSGKPPAART